MSRIRTNVITNRMANGAPTVSNGLVISGVTTTSDVNIGAGVTLNVYGGATYSGIVTATSFVGSGAQLTGITQTTINNNADNRVITGSGTANTLNGESGLVYNGYNLTISGTGQQQINVGSTNAGGAAIILDGDSNGDAAGGDYSFIRHNTDGDLEFFAKSTGGATDTIFRQGTSEKVRITSYGKLNVTGNVNVTGVGTFGGGVTIGYDTTSYSPIQKSDNTWFYTRLDQSSSISGTNIINLAQGSSKISDSIPRSVMTRQSDAGSYSLYHASSTNGSAVTNFSAADPFSPSTHGLTMGCLVRLHESGNNGSGVIFYGDTSSDNHFFVRYKYSSGGLRIGEDTDGSDNWSLAYPTDRFTNDNWYFTVFAVAGNGTLYVSLNGEEKIPIRTLGSPPTPTDARFGICGDPYNDNDSRHRYATMFWYKGLMSNDMIKAEYDWLKTIWTGASLP